MPGNGPWWDPASEELAEHFLAGEDTSEAQRKERVRALTIEIQAAIEAWFGANELPAVLDDPEVE
jgi:hypothetical protein